MVQHRNVEGFVGIFILQPVSSMQIFSVARGNSICIFPHRKPKGKATASKNRKTVSQNEWRAFWPTANPLLANSKLFLRWILQ
jgi:hypothetical protein